MFNKPVIGLTIGDPKGIGPEIVLKALNNPEVKRLCRPLLYGDPEFFSHRLAKKLTDKKAGELAYFYSTQAIQAALQHKIAAVVTAPINKQHLHLAGHCYPGQTELFAEKTKTQKFAMMLVSPTLKVAFATTHLPLSKVAGALKQDKILSTIELVHAALKNQFKIRAPKIAVAGFNPHAGEAGTFGSEEAKIIAPAIRAALKKKMAVSGPYPADTLFFKAVRGDYDAVIALYHDQGMIPLKLLHFDLGVNISLGLPFVRTSPDHGTAPDIAGKGIASPKSMIEAIKTAVQMIRTK